MDNQSHDRITKELWDIDPNIECVGIDAVHVSLARRPRYWWTHWYVQRFGEELESSYKSVRHLAHIVELPKVETVLDDGYLPRWKGNQKFHAFTRCRPVKQEPSKPTGKATASEGALQRWAQDSWRNSPYQYEEDLLAWKGENWRCLNSSERMVILGFPKGYLDAPKEPLTEDAKCELAGDVRACLKLQELDHP